MKSVYRRKSPALGITFRGLPLVHCSLLVEAKDTQR
jgi:hypothetical protein